MSALEKEQTKLQKISDKHSKVMKVATDADGALNSIQDRKDKLVKLTNWSQPTILQQCMLIVED